MEVTPNHIEFIELSQPSQTHISLLCSNTAKFKLSKDKQIVKVCINDTIVYFDMNQVETLFLQLANTQIVSPHKENNLNKLFMFIKQMVLAEQEVKFLKQVDDFSKKMENTQRIILELLQDCKTAK